MYHDDTVEEASLQENAQQKSDEEPLRSSSSNGASSAQQEGRRARLFLGDSEAFTFDFGDLTSSGMGEGAMDFQESGVMSAEKDENMAAAYGLPSRKVVEILPPDAVTAFRTAALKSAVENYCTLQRGSFQAFSAPFKPVKDKVEGASSVNAQLKQKRKHAREYREHQEEVVGFDEAVACFQGDLRAFEKQLWLNKKALQKGSESKRKATH